MTDPFQTLRDRAGRPVPVPPDADQRIRRRMLAAFDEASASGPVDGSAAEVVVELDRVPRPRHRRPATRLLFGAAAALLVVVALTVVLAGREEGGGSVTARSPSAAGPGPVPSESRSPVVVTGSTRWQYERRDDGAPSVAIPGFTVQVDRLGTAGDPTRLRFRNDVAGVFGFSHLTEGRDGSVELPPALLDPALGLVDCQDERGVVVSADLVGSGRPACDARIPQAVVTTDRPRTIDLDGAPVDATPVRVDWTQADEVARRTTLWLVPGRGVVRIDLDEGTTYTLEGYQP